LQLTDFQHEKQHKQEAQLPQRDSASAVHIYLVLLTDCAQSV